MADIDILYIRAGDGHLATAKALHRQLAQSSPSLNVNLIDLQSPELLGSLDILGRITGITGVDIYNRMLRYDLTILDPIYLFFSRLNIRLAYQRGCSILREFWLRRKPDLVVSLVPLFNGIILKAVEEASPTTECITILTDLCDFSSGYWLVNRTKLCLVPTERAKRQAIDKGLTPAQIRQSAGLILRPEFYNPEEIDRDNERCRLGLKPTMLTLIIMFGGNGSSVMKSILRRLNRLDTPIQAICLCGKDKRLADEVAQLHLDFKTRVVGYTSNVGFYMRLADVFIGKPGNISVCEAVHLGLPVITTHNRATLLQERYTGEWLEENGYGLVLRRWSEIPNAVHRLVSEGELERCHLALNSRPSNQALQIAIDWIQELVSPDESKSQVPTGRSMA